MDDNLLPSLIRDTKALWKTGEWLGDGYEWTLDSATTTVTIRVPNDSIRVEIASARLEATHAIKADNLRTPAHRTAWLQALKAAAYLADAVESPEWVGAAMKRLRDAVRRAVDSRHAEWRRDPVVLSTHRLNLGGDVAKVELQGGILYFSVMGPNDGRRWTTTQHPVSTFRDEGEGARLFERLARAVVAKLEEPVNPHL